MALSYSNKTTDEIPADAVLLSEDEALVFQWKVINEWNKKSETWALRHTSSILGGFSALTGIYVNAHYRSRLKLGNYGKFSTYLPIVVIPAMFSILTHKFAVQREVILRPMSECPVCLQTRASTIQAGFGVVYPTLLAPIASFMYATRHYTYRLPSITEQPREVFKIWQKMTRPILPVLSLICVAQAFATMYLTGKELEENIRLQINMKELEREAEEKYEEEKLLKQTML